MPRLIVNPGTDSAWEIRLQPGVNTLGRESENHFQIAHDSVSSSHCHVLVNDGAVTIKDLGSTNGTFVNGNPVEEAVVQSGQRVHLGSVELLLDAEADVVPPAPAAATKPRVRLAISKPEASAERAPAAVTQTEAPPENTAVEAPPLAPIPVGAVFCKSHLKTPARYLCDKCHKYFCDLCVTTRPVGGGTGKFCRTCGVPCVPVETHDDDGGSGKGFFARLPGVFVYPFRGAGVLVFILVTLLITGMEVVGRRSFLFFIPIMMITYGYVFSYMQSIIHTTAAGDDEMPSMPGFDGLFSAFFRLAGTVFVSFGLAIGLLVARLFDVPIPIPALIAAILLGCAYFPMAFLAVAMNDTVMSANPLIVIPAILKVPAEYLVTVILFGVIFGVQRLGDMLTGSQGQAAFLARDMSALFISFGIQLFWSFASMYMLTINTRILGLLYVTKKERFAWFSH